MGLQNKKKTIMTYLHCDITYTAIIPRPHVNRGGQRVRGSPGTASGFGLGHNGDDDLTWGEETGCSSISELD